jgi:hypothetical protein
MAWKLPFGKAKGVELDKAEVSDLKWVLGAVEEKLEKEPTSQYADNDRKLVAAIRAELAKRGEGGAAQAAGGGKAPAPGRSVPAGGKASPTGQSQSIQVAGKTSVIAFEGSFSNAARATEAIRLAQSQCHLVSPAPVCGSLPEGYELAITMVRIDPYGPGVYSLTGKKDHPGPEDTVGLDKVSLLQIGNAAGADWIISRRTDDRRTNFYCEWEAVAEIQLLDGRKVKRPGNVEIDARDGSGYIEEIRTKAEKRAREHPDWSNDGGDSQILELRKFYVRHAESKAMERAVANLGIRRSYKRKELEKPFAVVALSFTGRSDDAETRRYFAQRIADAALGSANNLYGGKPSLPGPGSPMPQLRAAPPVGSVPYDADAYDTEGEDYGDVANEPPPKSDPTPEQSSSVAESAAPTPPQAETPQAPPAHPAPASPAAQAGRAGAAGRTAGKAAPAAPPGQQSFGNAEDDGR